MEEFWRRSQYQQENESWQQLNHRLMSGYGFDRIQGNRLKQPATQHEETRKTKKDKNRIIAHSGISETEMTDMREDDENHRKSSHRIDVCYPLFRHSTAKVQFFFQYFG